MLYQYSHYQVFSTVNTLYNARLESTFILVTTILSVEVIQSLAASLHTYTGYVAVVFIPRAGSQDYWKNSSPFLSYTLNVFNEVVRARDKLS